MSKKTDLIESGNPKRGIWHLDSVFDLIILKINELKTEKGDIQAIGEQQFHYVKIVSHFEGVFNIK